MDSSGLSDLVRTTVDRGVGVISLNRPDKHNALNDELSEALHQAIGWACDTPEVRAVVIRGEGPSFSSGRDTTQLGHRPKRESDFGFVRAHQQARIQQLESTKPFIAAVRGYALGGAFELALVADIRICASDARMGFPEVGYGIMTDTGGAPLATILAGPSRAKWLLMTGELIDAERALAWGLVDQVVAPEQLDDTALDLAVRIAAGPPLAISMIKQVVDEIWHGPLHAGLRAELLAQSALFATADYHEAKTAYREKRRPRFEGR
jgi:enoyl-CoA hydratase/carnithine racemase